MEYRYDTQLLIDGKNIDEDAVNDYIRSHFAGDCLLTVGDEDTLKLHFHTNEPWRVLEYCASLGEIYDIVVEDMDRQARGLRMSFLSCAEMLTYAHEQGCTLAEAVLRSDLAESRLTEEASRAEMRRLWRVMQATSRDYEPSRRSRSGLAGGDAAKVEQAAAQGRLLGGDYLAAVTAEALKTTTWRR